MKMSQTIEEGNKYLKQLCRQKGLPLPDTNYFPERVLSAMTAIAEAANSKSGQPVTHFHNKEKVAAPTIKAKATEFSAKKAPLSLQAETREEQNARFRACKENTPQANGAWIRAMVKAGTVSAPTNFAEAVKDLQTLGCSKAEAVGTAVAAYPEAYAAWRASGQTHTL